MRTRLLAALALPFVLLLPHPAAADLLVSSWNTDEVLRYDDSTGAFLGAFVSAGSGGLGAPRGLTFGPDGNLYVNSFGTDQVLRYDGSTGAFLDAFVPDVGGLGGGSDLTFGPDGNLYVSLGQDINGEGAQVLRYDGSTGAFLDAFVFNFSGAADAEPFGLTFGPDGNLYVSVDFVPSVPPAEVQRYDGSTGAFLDALVSQLGGLSGLTFGLDGNLYVSNNGVADQVLRFDGSTGAFLDAFVPTGSGGLNEPSGLTFGPDGNLYVSSLDTNQVLRYDGSTGAFLDVFVAAGSGGLNAPRDLIFTPEPVPEPSSLMLICVGALGMLAFVGRRRPSRIELVQRR
jgi:streptogramin lyase